MSSKAFEAGKLIGEAISHIDFSVSERNSVALVKLPSLLFPEYVPDGNREYNRGEVIRVGSEKYMFTNWGKIDPNNPPRIEGTQVQPSLVKLYRDSGRYNWVREEFCLQGFERYYEDTGNPSNTGWYRVISDVADGAAPPPNDNRWSKIEP